MKKSKFIIEKLIASLILCGCLLVESTALVSASECELYGVQTLHLVSQPINCSVSVGSQASFTVKAEGTGLKYQWQVKFPNENWKNSGSTTATYSFTTEGKHKVEKIVPDNNQFRVHSFSNALNNLLNQTLAVSDIICDEEK